MSDKLDAAKADLYYRLAERAWNRFQDRRRLEWRNAFGIWTLLAVATVTVLTQFDSAVNEWMVVGGITFAVALVVLFDLWCLWIEEANAVDQKRGIYWEDKLIDMAAEDFPWKGTVHEPSQGAIPTHWVYRLELCLACVLAILFVVALFSELGQTIDLRGGPVMSFLGGLVGGVLTGIVVCIAYHLYWYRHLRKEVEALNGAKPDKQIETRDAGAPSTD